MKLRQYSFRRGPLKKRGILCDWRRLRANGRSCTQNLYLYLCTHILNRHTHIISIYTYNYIHYIYMYMCVYWIYTAIHILHRTLPWIYIYNIYIHNIYIYIYIPYIQWFTLMTVNVTPRKPSQGTGLRATFLGCNLFSLEIHWEVRVW